MGAPTVDSRNTLEENPSGSGDRWHRPLGTFFSELKNVKMGTAPSVFLMERSSSSLGFPITQGVVVSVCQGHFAPWQPLFFLLTGPCHIESLEEGDTFGLAFHLSVCLSNHPSLFSPNKDSADICFGDSSISLGKLLSSFKVSFLRP